MPSPIHTCYYNRNLEAFYPWYLKAQATIVGSQQWTSHDMESALQAKWFGVEDLLSFPRIKQR
jgi:hypothetical protein